MASPGSFALQRLRYLDTSLPDFEDELCNVLHGKDFEQCRPDLGYDDLVWLADYLDTVRRHIALSYSLLNKA
jgi:hypothetical protein